MDRKEARAIVSAIRADVVQKVGVCGFGTHVLTGILDELDEPDMEVVLLPNLVDRARAVEAYVPDFR